MATHDGHERLAAAFGAASGCEREWRALGRLCQGDICVTIQIVCPRVNAGVPTRCQVGRGRVESFALLGG